MRLHLLLIILFLFSRCVTSHSFSDAQVKILPDEKISLDSIDMLDPIIVGFDYPDVREYPVVPNPLYRRPDSIGKLFQLLMKEHFNREIKKSQRLPNCDWDFFEVVKENTFHRDKGRQSINFTIDSSGLKKCIEFPKNKTFLIFIFRLQTKESRGGNSSIWDEILGSYLIIRNEHITMYRQYRSYNLSRDSYFPKGSLDRANFPHFPQWQMEKVVKALVEDLKKRVQ